MAALKNARARFRLYLAWLLTRHPKFKPIYAADVVSYDAMAQAEHLADAGYYAAAAMLARTAVEARAKQLARIAPGWREANQSRFGERVIYLCQMGNLTVSQRNNLEKLHGKLSNFCNGEVGTRSQCLKAMRMAASMIGELDAARERALRSLDQPVDETPSQVHQLA